MEKEPSYIEASKQQAKEAGLDPSKIPAFTSRLSKDQLSSKCLEYTEVLTVVRLFMNRLLDQLKGNEILVFVSDNEGFVLTVDGDESIRNIVQQVGIEIGVQFTEENAGPNSISLALSLNQPIHLVGDNHYYHILHNLACYSVPFYFRNTNDLLGTITIMTSIDLAHPFYLTILINAVDSIERELLLRIQNDQLNILNQILINTTSNGIIITDKKGEILEFNQSAELITGVKKDFVLGKSIKNFKPISDYINEVLIEEIYHTNIELSLFNTALNKEFICLFDALPIFDKNQQIIGSYAQFRDITQIKETEQQLLESREKYKSLVEHNSDIIWTFDAKGKVVNVNPSAETITGYSTMEQINQTFVPFVLSEYIEDTQLYLEESLQGKCLQFDTKIVHKDQRFIDLNVKIVPIHINNQIVGVYGIGKDITEQKRIEELLRKSEKLSVAGQLAAGVAHEIRNPLTSIKGFLQLLQSKFDTYPQYFDIMLAELNRITGIVNEFLFLAKPQAANYQNIDIQSTLENVISLLEAQAIINNIKITPDFELKISIVYGVEDQLKQVFINILKNAIEAMPNGGMIIIQTRIHDPHTVMIRFIDEGQGISEDRIPLLGEPFFTTKEKGSGLGLMVSYKIIEEHKGSMNFQSKVHEGTTVEVFLPFITTMDPTERIDNKI